MNPSVHHHPDHPMNPEELAHRKRLAKRWAWVLGGAALLIYSIALSLPRY